MASWIFIDDYILRASPPVRVPTRVYPIYTGRKETRASWSCVGVVSGHAPYNKNDEEEEQQRRGGQAEESLERKLYFAQR